MSAHVHHTDFDPDHNGAGAYASNLFGLPFSLEEAKIIVLPVPWEATVSYGSGTSDGPAAIRDASFQLDLYDEQIAEAWKLGIAMAPVPEFWHARGKVAREQAMRVIKAIEAGEEITATGDLLQMRHAVNETCKELNAWVKNEVTAYLEQGRLVAILGGDHSSPMGCLQALSERYPDFGILQIDAHADLRRSYHGFEFSHASIMFNALRLPQVQRIVQVGIRDQAEGEIALVQRHPDRIRQYTSRQIFNDMAEGLTWKDICMLIVNSLPKKVYLSFDIDGLDPQFCPNTGTPVPGGLTFDQALFLIEKVVEEGKTIIGLDLCEVAPGKDEYDANVGARILYRICNLMGRSHQLI